MKKILLYTICAMLALTACHEVEFIESSADRQGLTSLTAYFTSGPYEDKELAKLTITDPEETFLEIPIPWYYPETSDDVTLLYMTSLRIRAELQPNFRLEPALSILDLTEENDFTLWAPDGTSKKITITGKRVHSSSASVVTLMINEVMINGIISKTENSILIPYKEDLSSVHVTAQVSPHATLSKIGGKTYTETGTYNLNTGSTVVVVADDGTEVTYSIRQGDPELLSVGINTESVEQLFNIDPVTTAGFPAYNEMAYPSLSGLGNDIIVCFGDGSAPVRINKYNGSKNGQIVLGDAVADVITNDDKGNMLIANYAESGQTVNIYRTNSASTAPTLYFSFENPVETPIGHKMKVIGDIDGKAVICFTSEGIDGVTAASKAACVLVENGAPQSDILVQDFASYGFGWSSAPIGTATVVPASTNPVKDGWYLDYYEGNYDPSMNDADESYLLHYISGQGKDNWLAHIGTWGHNPNCLDVTGFNNSTYMALFVVSHFPLWGMGPRLYLYDASTPYSASLLMYNDAIKWEQTTSYDGATGASGDVAFVPAEDGFRMFIYYYDHHCQALGAYVADCIKQ